MPAGVPRDGRVPDTAPVPLPGFAVGLQTAGHFICSLSLLHNHLRPSGVGIPVVNVVILCFLKFADDLILFVLLWSDMMVLVWILESWCVDFQMVSSIEKSKVVTAVRYHLWRILNLLNSRFEEVELLREFRYLGVLQRSGAAATIACNASS